MERLIREDNNANRHLSHGDFTIAWISALPTELAAAEGMLDERYPSLPTPPNDENTYVFGRMHTHNIVIACLPAGVYGTTSAATIASQIRSTFSSLRFGLMVGIGGGVPSANTDIRLGDVVVIQPTGQFGGVLQYDYGKAIHDGHFEGIGMLNKPPLVLLTAVTRMQAAHMLEPSRISDLILEMVAKWPAMKDEFVYPSNAQDLLFDCKYEHENSQDTCVNCDTSHQIKRVARVDYNPAIHYGLIGSANRVMKDGLKRDSLAQQNGILCFEMEAAGLMDNFPCLVIRGISDYADSHKNKHWQPYAAATAAAYAKELLSIIHEKQLVDATTASMTDPFYYGREVRAGAKSATSGPVQRSRHRDYEKFFRRISNYDHEKIHRRLSHKRFENTTQWFLDHPDFKAWFTEKSISNLWCSGKIGSGKTMIATAVVDAAKYRKSTLPTATVFYYCQNEQYESLQTGAILSSFIKQLCEILRRTSNSFPEVFMRGLQKFFGNDRTVPDFEDLEDLFMQIFYHVPNTVYVVDGIDALDGENSKRLLKLIQSIFCGRKSLEGSRILLLSRDHIEGYINISTFIPGIQHISTSTNIMGDIKKFIEMTIIDKTMHRKLTEDQGLLEELKSILLTESVGMFLWVYLQLEIIWSRCFTDAEIRLALSQLPKDLEETYQYCVQRIDLQDKRAVKVLKWVSFAARPLHIEELKEAVAFDILDTAWNPEKVPQQDFIIGCCANLVVLDPTDHCVRFAHSSVKQHLTKLREGILPTYPTSEDQGELECGEFCVAYLSFSNFSLSLEKHGHRQKNAMPNPALLAGEAMGPTLKHVFGFLTGANGATTLSFPRTPTSSMPSRSQFKFLDYAVMYWALQTRRITQDSPLRYKFEQLATSLNETWDFHLWVIPGLSKSSRLHGLFGWAVKERHEPLLSIALDSGKCIGQICDLPLLEERLPALHLASKLGYYDIVESLLDICNVNALDIEDDTALHHAARKGHIDIVELILSTKGAKIDFASKSKITPLWLASANGFDNIVSLLIVAGANIEARDDLYGRTPLWQAVEKGHFLVVELLIRNGANIEVRDETGFTPLWQAAQKGHYSVVALLVRNGANIEVSDGDYRTPLYQAAMHGHESVVDLLVDSGARTQDEHIITIIGGAESGKSTIIKQMLLLSGHTYRPTRHDRISICEKLLHAAQTVIKSMMDLNLEPVEPRNQEYSDFLLNYTLDPGSKLFLEPKVGDAISSLWKDKSMNKLIEHRTEVYFTDSMSYLFREAKRISGRDYLPTEADWLRMTGVTDSEDMRVCIDEIRLRFMNFGNRRRFLERFAGSIVIFCAALSEYDQPSLEDGNQNQLRESLKLFDSMISNTEKTILLFLTQFDLLKQKLLYSPLAKYFPDYTGGDDADSAAKYILEQFEKVNKGRLKIYPHLIEATEPRKFQEAFPAIKRDIVKSQMARIFINWQVEPHII